MINEIGKEDKKMKDGEEYLKNVHWASGFLNFGEVTIYKKCKKNEIPHIILGKKTIRFDPRILEGWVKSQRKG